MPKSVFISHSSKDDATVIRSANPSILHILVWTDPNTSPATPLPNHPSYRNSDLLAILSLNALNSLGRKETATPNKSKIKGNLQNHPMCPGIDQL
jgi:hypothetical protein